MNRGNGSPRFGERVRALRRTQGISQLKFAGGAGISPRHLSFIETGRARPSQEMVLRVAAHLGLDTSEQDALLLAAGFAPRQQASMLSRTVNNAEAEVARAAAQRVLESHRPFPAVAMNGDRDIVLANPSARVLMSGVSAQLMRAPMNLYRIMLHPRGLAPKIIDFPRQSGHILHRLQRDAEQSGSLKLKGLVKEAKEYPNVCCAVTSSASYQEALFLRIREARCDLSFFTALTTFSSPVDLVKSELVVETLFPADAHTERYLTQVDSGVTGGGQPRN